MCYGMDLTSVSTPYTNMPDSPPHRLRQLLKSQDVVDLPTMQAALGEVSAMTVFRHLRQVPYRRSYNHNGRYYTVHDPSRFDRFGLWSVGDIHFSVEGSLRKTVRRLVEEAKDGATHHELQQRLRVRVHNTLLDLLHKGEVERERLLQLYVYFHIDPAIRAAQRQRRDETMLETQRHSVEGEVEVTEHTIIEVLLTLLHHPGSTPAQVVRRLRGHAPPIPIEQVRLVFARYALDDLGKKGGRWSC